MQPDRLAEIMELAVWAGELLLRNGAETWRIEDTVYRLLAVLGAVEIDIVATPTAIFLTTSDGRESRTRVRRVYGGTLNLAMVDAVNNLSRQAAGGRLTLPEIRAELERIEGDPPLYRLRTRLLAGMVGASGFAILFGGGMAEVLATLPGAAALATIDFLLGRTRLPGLARTAVAATVGTLIAATVAPRWIIADRDLVILSTVVLLVPGAAIVNAIGDLMGGHLLSGLAKGAASILMAAAIAAGVAAALQAMGALP